MAFFHGSDSKLISTEGASNNRKRRIGQIERSSTSPTLWGKNNFEPLQIGTVSPKGGSRVAAFQTPQSTTLILQE
jgi:hypothetical protein